MINHIIKTLQKEKSVLINGLGEFVVQLKHATAERNVVHPPQYEVVFHPTTDMVNNFSLANTISFEKQCLFTEANEEIIKWVDELKKALENNKSVDFEDFGSFSLDRKGDITFSSAKIPQLNTLFDYFDDIDLKNPTDKFDESDEFSNETSNNVIEKTPVITHELIPEPQEEDVVVDESTAEPLTEEHIVTETVPESQQETISEQESVIEPISENKPEENVGPEHIEEADQAVEPISEPQPEVIDEPDENKEEEDDDESKKRHVSAWLWILFLLLLVIAVLGFIFKDKIFNAYKDWKGKSPDTEIIQENSQETDNIDLDASAPTNDIEDFPEEEQLVEESQVENVAYTPEIVKHTADNKYPYIRFESGHFYAIAGSFYTEQEVEKHIKQKHLEQYSPSILLQDGVKNLRVCIGVFDTEEEAETFAKNVNKNNWVLK